MINRTLTALKGVKVGHATYTDKLQGVTVVVFDKPYPVSYKANGGTARLYDNQIMNDGKSYPLKHAIFISDGAHKGLETAAEVAKGLRKEGVGWNIERSLIPSITGATVMSLGMKLYDFDPKYGYEAVKNITNNSVVGGNVGAGTGTSVGKFSWTKDGKCLAMKTGVGSARIDLPNGIMICALSVVNALGNIIGRNGQILAGNRNDDQTNKFRTFGGFSHFLSTQSNTTISIVGTNAKIESQEDLRKIAEIATHGQVRAINPVNTSIDGDTVFVFSTEELDMKLSPAGKNIEKGDWYKIRIDILGQKSADAIQESIYDACNKAETIKFELGYQGIIPSVKDY
jgi:L-aminopeptidase/D-esterase-like protein